MNENSKQPPLVSKLLDRVKIQQNEQIISKATSI
jgi:hypothetical protein